LLKFNNLDIFSAEKFPANVFGHGLHKERRNAVADPCPFLNEHFIDIPDIPKPTLFPAQRPSIDRSKLDAPGSDRLVRDGGSSLREQVLDIAKAECEPTS
jgi:hypothetical protein